MDDGLQRRQDLTGLIQLRCRERPVAQFAETFGGSPDSDVLGLRDPNEMIVQFDVPDIDEASVQDDDLLADVLLVLLAAFLAEHSCEFRGFDVHTSASLPLMVSISQPMQTARLGWLKSTLLEPSSLTSHCWLSALNSTADANSGRSGWKVPTRLTSAI